MATRGWGHECKQLTRGWQQRPYLALTAGMQIFFLPRSSDSSLSQVHSGAAEHPARWPWRQHLSSVRSFPAPSSGRHTYHHIQQSRGGTSMPLAPISARCRDTPWLAALSSQHVPCPSSQGSGAAFPAVCSASHGSCCGCSPRHVFNSSQYFQMFDSTARVISLQDHCAAK